METIVTTEARPSEITLIVRMPRCADIPSTAMPVTVTQHTASVHFGIPPTAFKGMARAGRFPVKRIGRLLFATYADVHHAVTEGAAVVRRKEVDVPARSAPPTDAELERMVAEAAMYIAASTTRAEMGSRKREISGRGWSLAKRHEVHGDDGTVNPDRDERMYGHGMDLVLTAGIQRFGEAAQWYEPRRATR